MRNLIIFIFPAFLLLQYTNGIRAQEETDPYLWLEQIEGEKALSWVESKNEATLAVLKAQPMFEDTY